MNTQTVCRTSYFHPLNEDEFFEWVQKLRPEGTIEKDDDGGVALFFAEGVPTAIEEDEDYHDIDFLEELSRFVREDEMVFVTEGGFEGFRWAGGWAAAVTHGKVLEVINTDDFIEKMADKQPHLKSTPPVC